MINSVLYRILTGLRRTMSSYIRSRHGGGMLIFCSFSLITMSVAGAAMTNYAWKEAQWEELRAALRASVSSAGPLLAGAGGALDEAIKERVAQFLQGSLPGIEVTKDDVTVEYDATTRVTTIGIEGNYALQDIWLIGEDPASQTETGDAVAETVAVRFEVDRYEVGIALDISSSMAFKMPDGHGGDIVKIDALKNAMSAVVDIIGEISANDPASILASIVPFGTAVNVADTCNLDPDTALCKAERSPGKERYLSMLAGPHETMTETLSAARTNGRHWVDMYHHYGAAEDLGALAALRLPQDLLDNRDWNLRRTNVEIDVRAQAPNLDTGAASGLGYWQVNDEDFWNGCVMARWGSYWDADARKPGWTVDDPDNWPAKTNVPAWTGGTNVLTDLPLHLSDAPPDAADPRTLFTAYSWPDARIGGTTDHRLQSVMMDLLGDVEDDPNAFSLVDIKGLRERSSQGDNDWSVDRDRGGADQCPPTPLTPLTDDLDELRAAALRLQPVLQHGHSRGAASSTGGTNLSLGVVWGLRTISPLWRNVWAVTDAGDTPRPGTPCAPGETATDCDPKLNKAILIVSDGSNFPGRIGWRLTSSRNDGNNPVFAQSPFSELCRSGSRIPNYKAAAKETTESEFNSHFAAYVDANGRFTSADSGTVADIFHRYLDDRFDPARPDDPDPETARRSARAAALVGMTPWQIFRGIGSDDGIRAALDSTNRFGFDGRPVQTAHVCLRSTLFSPYGRADDSIRVGESTSMPATLLPPSGGVSPFSGDFADDRDSDVVYALRDKLDDWFLESCRLAGLRRVRVNAVYIGNDSYLPPINNLKQCVQVAGGDPNTDVYVTPTAAALHDTFVEIFTIRRNLRFLN